MGRKFRAKIFRDLCFVSEIMMWVINLRWKVGIKLHNLWTNPYLHSNHIYEELFMTLNFNFAVNFSSAISSRYSRLNRLLFGMESAFWFHIVNVVLHSLSSILFTRICSKVAGFKPNYSLLAGIFFAVHPIHTESKLLIITSSTSLNDSMSDF